MTRVTATLLAVFVLCSVGGPALRAQTGAAFFLRSLATPAERRESRPEVLDAPVLPGSIMKAVTLAAALESHVIEPETARLCRRTVTAGGTRYTCSHPDLKRPLTPAEALAYSCDDFFTSLAPRLTRAMFNDMRTRLGMPPIAAAADLAASFVGLDGPRITPRALLDVIARLADVDADRRVALRADTRRVVLAGLRGGAEYGTAAALRDAGVTALAKTGTSPMPGGAWMEMVIALEPAARPSRALIVVAPGTAGLDAAAIAADLLRATPRATNAPLPVPEPPASPTLPGPAKSTPLATAPPATVRVSIKGRTSVVNLEDYVARVVAGEGQPRAADAAQQALAITARTYAVANLNRHRREGYDLCDTTHCQVVRPATDTTRRAAQATAGRLLTRQGRAASVFYSALCGGHTELASNVWPGATDYTSHAHADDACREEPGWSSELRVEQLERALRAAGHRGGRLRDLRVVDRNASGRVARVRIDGFTPPEMSGHDFRMAVARIAGWQQMKSTAFEVRRIGSGYRFIGRGFGHGVGLCVIGAGNRAARGTSADEILRFYFPALTVEQHRPAVRPVPGSPAASVAGNTPPASAPSTAPAGAATGDDVRLALPAADERDRSQLVQLIRRTRAEVAKVAGVGPPSSLRVTVHPSVEAFARATGRPWWVSGATDGTAIHLLPLAVLRQRGQLERTVRHEVAHAVVDAALKERPLWVREGAAFYFSDPASTVGTDVRGSCPGDEEFLRPPSAGAHRNAYARAEACFRRQVAQGRRWMDVR